MISSGVFIGVLFSVQQITPFPAPYFKENLPVRWRHSRLLFSPLFGMIGMLNRMRTHSHLSMAAPTSENKRPRGLDALLTTLLFLYNFGNAKMVQSGDDIYFSRQPDFIATCNGYKEDTKHKHKI